MLKYYGRTCSLVSSHDFPKEIVAAMSSITRPVPGVVVCFVLEAGNNSKWPTVLAM